LLPLTRQKPEQVAGRSNIRENFSGVFLELNLMSGAGFLGKVLASLFRSGMPMILLLAAESGKGSNRPQNPELPLA
jgi:hypothetical protein